MEDKLVVVSGGTKGIGRQIIRKFSEKGFCIATYSRNEGDLAALKKEVEKEFGTILHYKRVDAQSKDQVLGFADFVSDLGIPIAVLINNAGAFEPGTVLEEDDGVLERTMSTNLNSAYYLSRKLIPSMKGTGGHVFNICSTASIMAYTNGGSYCISKYALLGMSKVLREELKNTGVRVTAVLPGATYTSSWERSDLPPERFMKVEDLADIIYATYLLSENTVVEEILLRPQLGDI